MIPLIAAFLKQARESRIAVYLVYGWPDADGRANIASASNVDPKMAEGLRRTMLGIDDQSVLAAAQALHQAPGGCDVCFHQFKIDQETAWHDLSHSAVQAHIRPAQIVIDAVKERSTARPGGSV